jgi:hypothetical protein
MSKDPISPELLTQMRERISLVHLISGYVPVQRRGREYHALCPFHAETTPSFVICPEKGFYHCFGCGAHGDAIKFVMEKENLSFNSAVRKLTEKAGFPTHSTIEFYIPFKDLDDLSQMFIEEQIAKCNQRIQDQDYYGAITSARSLVEAVLREIERRVLGKSQPYDGDILKLYKRVQKHQNLDPGEADLCNTLRQILSGLTSIVAGVGTLRNAMSDSHPPRYRPSEHHARLAVNAAKTLCDFLVSSHLYQESKKPKCPA